MYTDRFNKVSGGPVPLDSASIASHQDLDRYLLEQVARVKHVASDEIDRYWRNYVREDGTPLAILQLPHPVIYTQMLKKNELNDLEVMTASLNMPGEVVLPWCSNILNTYNQAYYSSPDAFFEEHRPHSLFGKIQIFRKAIAHLITTKAHSKNVKIKELASGNKAYAWISVDRFIGQPYNLDITLTDNSPHLVMPRVKLRPGLKLTPKCEDLLAESEELPHSERYDMIFSFYGVDSVSFPGDICLCKSGNDWFQCLQRIKLRHSFNRKWINKSLGEQVKINEINRAKHFEHLVAETIMLPIDIDKIPFSDTIKARLVYQNEGMLTVQLGLARKIAELFDKQISANGILVLSEVGDFEPSYADGVYLERKMHTPTAVSRTGARYTVADYVVLQNILARLGIELELIPLGDYVRMSLGNDAIIASIEVERATIEACDGYKSGQLLAIAKRA